MQPLQDRIQHQCERLLDTWPRRKPDSWRLQQCRVISHRGIHDNRRVLENTIAAFRAAAEAGVWGIELDLRWTRDDVPMVFHDRDLVRLRGLPVRIEDLAAARLAKQHPWIPTFKSVIAAFGGRQHQKKSPEPHCASSRRRTRRVPTRSTSTTTRVSSTAQTGTSER